MRKIVDTILPTTMVGSYPRPAWFTYQLLGRDARGRRRAGQPRLRLRDLSGPARAPAPPAGSMNGGEQQMVALGRALMSAPNY